MSNSEYSGDFSNKFVECLKHAEELAVKNNNSELTTEHVLIAMIDLNIGAGSFLIRDACSAGIRAIKKDLVAFIESEEGEEPKGISYSQELKEVFKQSKKVSQTFGSNFVKTEHFLIAVLQMEITSRMIFNKHGLEVADIRKSYMKIEDKNNIVREVKNIKINTIGKKPSPNTKSKNNQINLCTDMTQNAISGKYLPLVGRDREIKRLIQIIGRKTKNNPIILGEAGTGKTALVEGLVSLSQSDDCPQYLKGKKFYQVDISSLVAGTKYRGQFEDRLKNIIEEFEKDPDAILVIDEIHNIVGAGSAEGSTDAANMLKAPLSRGQIRVIGLTTLEEYRKHIEKDGALSRRFQPVNIEIPTAIETIGILNGIKDIFEEYHGVSIGSEEIEEVVKLADRYITDRNFPDKAIDVMDETMSRVKIEASEKPLIIKELQEEEARIKQEITKKIDEEDYEACKDLQKILDEVGLEIIKENKKWSRTVRSKNIAVSINDIANVVSFSTGIPLTTIVDSDEKERLMNMENEIKERIISQDRAVVSLSKVIRRSRMGLKDPNRPQGSFMFLGPTGTGKSECSKALAEYLFGDDSHLIKIDMSEFMEKHSVSKLLGSPPGYVGHDDAGIFEKVRRKPHCVILFDEIEKAHPDVWNILLQIMEDGQVTDSHKNVISFRNAIIILTSNIGVKEATDAKMGFRGEADKEKTYDELKKSLMGSLKKTFKPELINRFDDIIVFDYLSKDDCGRILEIYNSQYNKKVYSYQGYSVSLSDEVKSKIMEEGFDKEFGARPLRRAYQRVVLDNLTDHLLMNVDNTEDINNIYVDIKDNEVIFDVVYNNQEVAV